MYSRAKQRQKKVWWPDLRYGPHGECKLFNCPEEVPLGWVSRTKPEQEKQIKEPTRLNRAELIKQLSDLGMVVSATWSVSYLQELLDNRGVPTP